MGKNLKVLVDNANSEIKRLADFLENNSSLYENRSMSFDDIITNKKALMIEFNLTDKEFNEYFNDFVGIIKNKFDDWEDENDIVHVGYYFNAKPFNLRNDIIEVCENGLDLVRTIENIIYENFSSDTFISYFIGENGLINFNNIKTTLEELNNEYGLTLDSGLEDLKYNLDYISNNLYDDFMNMMYDSIEVNKYLNVLNVLQMKWFRDYLGILVD